MIGIDTKILIDILVKTQPDHNASLKRMESSKDQFAITYTNLGEVLRLLTHPKVFQKPLKLSLAIDTLESFMDAFDITILNESETWWKELAELCQDLSDLRGNEVFDARIALCLKHHGVREIWTKDSDFRKYSFLRIHKP